MIRFCDREVDCIEYCSLSDRDALNRADLLMYFLEDRKDAVVCVYDDFNSMEFLGIITYQSLNSSLTFRGSIQTECFVLDENIWENARLYFKRHVEGNGEIFVIPVLNQNGELICFAYDDSDANREIRQLRELSEMPEALQFADIYSEYKCVKIHEFNELAYYFAKYLESQNITVQVEGVMWQGFFDGEACQVPDYECLHIYAEGTWEKSRNWKESLLRSVSVEFECIAKVYEANIKEHLIENSGGGEISELLVRLCGEKEIVLCGIGREEQNAYDYLKGNGIEVCGFIGIQNEEYGHTLFGKRIMSSLEARAVYKNAVFIECKAQNSAWGFGGIDFYDYIGYRRNERFILLRDYVEVPENSLNNLLKDMKIVLTGEINLCRRLFDFLKSRGIFVHGYFHTVPEEGNLGIMPEIYIDALDAGTLCLIVAPVYFKYKCLDWKGNERDKEIRRYLIENHIYNYTDFFSDMRSFIAIEKNVDIKYGVEYLKPHKIVLGSIEAGNGNEFFRALLDEHCSIAMMWYGELNENLFWTCVCLSQEEAPNVLPVFWKMMEEDMEKFINPDTFSEKMKLLLSNHSKFTSQELFVMFHVAYLYMCGRDITGNEIKDMLLYWEPHHMERAILEECAEWLRGEEENVSCDIVNVVRNICMHNGHGIKLALAQGVYGAYFKVLRYPDINKKDYEGSDRLVVRFEDLKCKPVETLKNICDRWGIVWSDSLIQTTYYGKENIYTDRGERVTGFDLKPVYNTYEQFFTAFDRFRLMLINAPWQRKYDYPFVEISQFTRRELQEMFLIGFRFENLGDTEEYRDSLDYRIWLQMQIREKLQKTRMIEMTENVLCSDENGCYVGEAE